MVGEKQKPNSFDPARFRISTGGASGDVVRKVITTIPVRKPGKQSFVRCHPSPAYRAECGLLTLDGDDRPFIVDPSVVHLVSGDLKTVQLRVATDRQGNISLWPVPLPPIDGAENSWNLSHRQIADLAEDRWVRMVSNRGIGAYDVLEATGEIPDPVWPELNLEEIFEIAFGGGHVIESRDHPALRILRGES